MGILSAEPASQPAQTSLHDDRPKDLGPAVVGACGAHRSEILEQRLGRALSAIKRCCPRRPSVTPMPWTEARYPPSMQSLPAWVRRKAIDIANALLDAGMEEGKAIRIAIAKAR